MSKLVELTRPLVRYHGGKWKLAPWIISHFPDHRIYVEPFGGGGSVLLKKPRAYSEVYNDLDGEIYNLFKMAREQGQQLKELCRLTPFSRTEFQGSYLPADDPLEQARRTLVRSFMGFGSAGASGQATGFRANSNRSGTTPAHDWANYPDSMDAVIERLRGVVLENRDAVDCLKQHDSDQTLIYVDPPYVLSTRYQGEKTDCYRHEMSDQQHHDLAAALHAVQGMVIVSGYSSQLYDLRLYPDWTRIERTAFADGARERIEVLWINEACRLALADSERQAGLFS